MCSCIRNTKSDWLQRRQLTFVHKTFHRGVLNASVGFRTPLVLARKFFNAFKTLSTPPHPTPPHRQRSIHSVYILQRTSTSHPTPPHPTYITNIGSHRGSPSGEPQVLSLHIYIYTYIHTYTCIHMLRSYIYIYI